ncbi:MAG: hypothetical protein AAF677_00920 [Pseudomonadota bacterium]
MVSVLTRTLRRAAMATALACGTLAAGATTVAAERIVLVPDEQIYGCTSRGQLESMLRAAGDQNYFRALARVGTYEQNACPTEGPFRDDVIFATVVHRENAKLAGGHNSIAIVKWRFKGSSVDRYSMVVRNGFGTWADAIDTVLQLRTLGGIVDFMQKQ